MADILFDVMCFAGRIGVFLAVVFATQGLVASSTVFAQSPGINSTSRPGLIEFRTNGVAFLQRGEWAAADAMFDKALAVKATDGLSLYGKAVARFNLKRIDEADKLLTGIIGSRRTSAQLLADALVLSAVIESVRGHNAAAIVKLGRAAALVPKHFDANFSLGRALFERGDIERSVAAFRKAVSIKPTHLKARFFLATALERLDDPVEAVKQYREMLRLDPTSIDGLLGLGILLLKTEGDNSVEGLKLLDEAVSRDPSLYESQVVLGKTLLRKGQLSKAIDHLSKAAALLPNNPEPHFQLAILYRKLGDKAKADAESEIVKQIHERRRGIAKQDQ